MEINNFGPFNSDVWGTVSDWIMVLVTAITLYFLWRTLVSQQKALLSQLEVQKLQQQTTLIEQERFRLEVQPNFTMFISKKEIRIKDDQIEIILILDTQLLQAECRKLQVTNSSLFGELFLDHVLPNDNELVPIEAHRLLMVCLKCEKEMFDLTGMNLSSEFHFEDTIGNKYRQTIALYLTYTEEKIVITKPFIDSEV
jgi:hypothetical protein